MQIAGYSAPQMGFGTDSVGMHNAALYCEQKGWNWNASGNNYTGDCAPFQAPAPAPANISNVVTVSPVIQTSISPQISPNFVQTGAGSTGSVGATTQMSAPTSQQAQAQAAADQAAAQKAAQDAARQDAILALLSKMSTQQAASSAAAPVGSQGAVTPQPVYIPAPSGGGAPTQSLPLPAPADIVAPSLPGAVSTTAPLPSNKNMLILAAIAGVGLIVIMSTRGKRK